MALKPQEASESPRHLVETDCWAFPGGLGWGQRSPAKFPGGAGVAGPWTTLREPQGWCISVAITAYQVDRMTERQGDFLEFLPEDGALRQITVGRETRVTAESVG